MDVPVVTSLGHAGLRIDAPGLRLLCDPWLSPGGTFLGSWLQFPDNSHLRRPDILDCDWVAISHEHLDHLDLPLLQRLPASVRLLVDPHHLELLGRGLPPAAGSRPGRRAWAGDGPPFDAARQQVAALGLQDQILLLGNGTDVPTILPVFTRARQATGSPG
jgi:L-ascorbate metabolism protein UlaG (beta-lactamase superfamily)